LGVVLPQIKEIVQHAIAACTSDNRNFFYSDYMDEVSI